MGKNTSYKGSILLKAEYPFFKSNNLTSEPSSSRAFLTSLADIKDIFLSEDMPPVITKTFFFMLYFFSQFLQASLFLYKGNSFSSTQCNLSGSLMQSVNNFPFR